METVTENPEAVSFEKIADQSRAALSAETATQVKNKGGRPLGSKNKKGRENETPAQTAPPVQNTEPQITLPQGNYHAEVLPQIDLEPLAKDAVKIPFSVWAFKTGEPALELTDDEGKTASFYLNRVINLHFPELQQKDAKTFSLYALVLSVFSLFVKKSLLSMAIGREKRARVQAELAAQAKASQNQPSERNSGPVVRPEPNLDGPTISANDYFARR